MSTKTTTVEQLAIQPTFVPERVIAREVLNLHRRDHGGFDKAALVAEVAAAIAAQRARMLLHQAAADTVMPSKLSGSAEDHAHARELLASLAGGR